MRNFFKFVNELFLSSLLTILLVECFCMPSFYTMKCLKSSSDIQVNMEQQGKQVNVSFLLCTEQMIKVFF